MLRLPNVSKAELVGVQEDRIFVELAPKRLASLGIDPAESVERVRRSIELALLARDSARTD